MKDTSVQVQKLTRVQQDNNMYMCDGRVINVDTDVIQNNLGQSAQILSPIWQECQKKNRPVLRHFLLTYLS